MNKANFETDLRQQLAALDKQIQPERDLWPGIEVALAESSSPQELCAEPAKHSRPKLTFFAVAASMAFVGVLTWFGMQPEGSPALNSQQLVQALSEQHQSQKQALLVKFQDQPALTENWQTQLQELDAAAQAIKAALQHEPNNMALLKMLQQVHQQQIDLIERVHAPKWRQI